MLKTFTRASDPATGTGNRNDAGIPHGAEVIAFARPHELDIEKDLTLPGGLLAKVTRILAFGLTARVELERMDAAGILHHHEVEVTLDRLVSLHLRNGDAVRLVPSRLKVFRSPDPDSTNKVATDHYIAAGI